MNHPTISRNHPECMYIATKPARLLERRLAQLAQSPPEPIDGKHLPPEANKELTRKERTAKE